MQGLVISACRKPELIEFLNWLSGGLSFDWTKPSQESLSRTKWFYVPIVRLYYLNLKKALPGFQFITVDRMSLALASPLSLNARKYL